ncbi:MAG TPA: hypothetical protein VH328_14730 [Burkholderiaceae bacterium]|nr:hypothetical protein [Burkholderiaceae bacterium]
MNQAAFPFVQALRGDRAKARTSRGFDAGRHGAAAPAAVRDAADPADALGFDHARYGLVPPAAVLWPGHPVREGWERGRLLVGRRTRPATLAVQRWLGLRLAAWSRGQPFDDHQITPQVLRSLEASARCPITGLPLDDRSEVVTVDAGRGWVAGNLALVSPEVAATWRGIDWPGARLALARAEAEPGSVVDGYTLRGWRRIVSLKSLATPLPDREAAALPLAVLPPNRLRLLNPLQELQAVLTLELAVPGWGTRARTVAEAMPLGLRSAFNLFFNTLMAQAMRQGLGSDKEDVREALALAWEDPVVQRRWGRFARLVDAALARTLVDRLAQAGLPGLHVVRHDDAAMCMVEA